MTQTQKIKELAERLDQFEQIEVDANDLLDFCRYLDVNYPRMQIFTMKVENKPVRLVTNLSCNKIRQ